MVLMEVEMHIHGMTSDKSEGLVRAALGSIPGVKVLHVNWRTGAARVAITSPRVSLADLPAALQRVGFHAHPGSHQ